MSLLFAAIVLLCTPRVEFFVYSMTAPHIRMWATQSPTYRLYDLTGDKVLAKGIMDRGEDIGHYIVCVDRLKLKVGSYQIYGTVVMNGVEETTVKYVFIDPKKDKRLDGAPK